MADSYTRPYRTARGDYVAGAAAREARIKDQGGMDRIANRHYMRGFADGYEACKEDTAHRMDNLEARVNQLERRRNSA